MLEQLESPPGSGAASIIFTKDPRRPSTPVFASSFLMRDSLRPSTPIRGDVLKRVTKQSFLSWSAGSAGMIEIIEYMEELVDLAKLLVGVNAFRTGMLERPRFHEYIMKIRARERAASEANNEEVEKVISQGSARLKKRRTFSFRRVASEGTKRRRSSSGVLAAGGEDAAASSDEGDAVQDLPMSLQRVRTKRIEEREFERMRRMSTSAASKGKHAMKSAKTWQV
jgi:hypothetical protein